MINNKFRNKYYFKYKKQRNIIYQFTYIGFYKLKSKFNIFIIKLMKSNLLIKRL